MVQAFQAFQACSGVDSIHFESSLEPLLLTLVFRLFALYMRIKNNEVIRLVTTNDVIKKNLLTDTDQYQMYEKSADRFLTET